MGDKTSYLGNGVYKFCGADVVNCYLLKEEKIVIDTGNPKDREWLKGAIEAVIGLKEIKDVLLTHLHYDHSGNVRLFPDAKFYTSKEEIDAFNEHKSMLTFDYGFGVNEDIEKAKLRPIKDFSNPRIKVLFTPGHSPGGISFIYEGKDSKKYLFSGDVIFEHGTGRIDLPTSIPDKMNDSITQLEELEYDILCPGHDY